MIGHPRKGRIIMRNRFSGSVAAALAIAVAVTSLDIAPAQAAPKKSGQSQATQSTAAETDFSARRRWHGGSTIAALAAADQYRNGYYYGDPGYGYGYAPGYTYGHWHHHHHWH
jgi:hypothetical protein